MILHEVITTEKVPFSYRVAGLGSRFLAWLVDAVLIVLLLLMGFMLAGVMGNVRPGLASAISLVWMFLVVWGYFPLFEWLWHGQTPGKYLLGIRVIQWQGTSITFFQAALRNVLRVADALPGLLGLFPVGYGVGFLVAACNRENRRLGDLVAGTLVVHVERKAQPIRAVHEADAAEVRAAMVRQRLGQLDREQKQLLLDICLRRDQLRVSDRARLFQATADFLQHRLDLTPDEFQSAEKFVLQMASVLGERGA
jgi:uncharacterized RDD family membrane protein YckC